ncbi:MAG TPA: MFS transporter, partial [Hyphomicrobiaceae bacterium]|nr:MFS transporter [Hyphomicrobiaceae bacterium]
PVFLFSAAFGQLVFGPMSDRYGRRPVILAGLALYFAGAIAGLVAPSLTVMLGGRMLQGLGSACGIVVARAVLRDSYQGGELARSMAMASGIISIGPVLAPLIGVGLIEIGGWRAVFAGMAAFGALLLASGSLWLAETNRDPNPTAMAPKSLLAAGREVLGHRQSRFFIALAGLNSFMVLSLVTNAPRLFKSSFGLEGLGFATLFAVNGLAVIVGQAINTRLISRIGPLAATRFAAGTIVAAGALIALLSALDRLNIILFAVLIFAFSTAFPIVMSNSASLTIDPHRRVAGMASSIFGFSSQIVSSILVFATLSLYGGAMLPWAIGLTMAAAITFIALMLYRPPYSADPVRETRSG